MVTAATLHKENLFADAGKLTLLEHGLLSLAKKYQWQIEAWAVFTNHYHFVAHSPAEGGAKSLREIISVLHMKTATWINRLDKTPGRHD